MRKPLFNSGVKCSRLGVLMAALSLLGMADLEAQPYGQVPPPGQIENPAYAQAPSYAVANNGAYAPGAYQPPTVTGQGYAKPKTNRSSQTQAAVPANYNYGAPMTLEGKVGQLAQNDERQDQRLHHLERDVSNLKAGANKPNVSPEGGHYVSKPAAASAGGAKYHTVRDGETLWRIAAKYSTSVNDLRAANRISGNTVSVGQVLLIPGEAGAADAPPAASEAGTPSNVHVVKKGQTFEDIAKTYKVSPDALARANPSAYPDKLLIGEKLTIPGRRASAAPSVAASEPSQAQRPDYYPPAIRTPTSTKPRTAAPVADKSGTHTVRAGESLGAIAKSYGVPTARLVAANEIKNPDLVEVGRVLIIPGGTGTAPTQTALAPAKKPVAPRVAANTPRTSDTVPLPGAGLPLSKPQAAAKPAPPPAMEQTAATTPAPAKKPAAMQVGSHRGVLAYRLERGDSLDSVANMFSTTPEKIRELNKLGPDAKVKEGEEVVVPAMGPVSVN